MSLMNGGVKSQGLRRPKKFLKGRFLSKSQGRDCVNFTQLRNFCYLLVRFHDQCPLSLVIGSSLSSQCKKCNGWDVVKCGVVQITNFMKIITDYRKLPNAPNSENIMPRSISECCLKGWDSVAAAISHGLSPIDIEERAGVFDRLPPMFGGP